MPKLKRSPSRTAPYDCGKVDQLPTAATQNPSYHEPLRPFLENVLREAYVSSSPESPAEDEGTKIPRNIYKKWQQDALESYFNGSHYPDATDRNALANQLGVPLKNINIWFQNRRAKEKNLHKKCSGQKENPLDKMRMQLRGNHALRLPFMHALSNHQQHIAPTNGLDKPVTDALVPVNYTNLEYQSAPPQSLPVNEADALDSNTRKSFPSLTQYLVACEDFDWLATDNDVFFP